MNYLFFIRYNLHKREFYKIKQGNIFQVKVEMTDVVNCALHVSVNSGTDSEVEVTVDRSFNSSIHLRYVFDRFFDYVNQIKKIS